MRPVITMLSLVGALGMEPVVCVTAVVTLDKHFRTA
ncbi:hypothetical protein MLPF_3263 [Mycobacterium lepromatosis]|nr:hypothetical protein MLPF_3263 [Mycobacterium lepromatosis]